MSDQASKFDTKVAELVALCRPLDLRQIMLVRRMTMIDPEALKWATPKQLDAVFTVILTEALQRVAIETLEAAADQQFEPLLPPGSEDDRNEDRWMLYRLSRPFLTQQSSAPVVAGPTLPSMETPELEEEDEAPPPPFSGFGAMFDDTICRYVRKSVTALSANLQQRPHTPPPFYLTQSFPPAMEQVLRRLVLKQMRNNRTMKELSEKHNWAKAGNGRLIAMIQSNSRDNPIRFQWDSRWDALVPPPPGATPNKAKPVPAEELPWQEFADHGAANGYLAPTEKDGWILKSLLRWEAEAIAAGWQEVAQLYIQEFAPASRHDKLRDGAFRDGLVKWIDRLPAHAGEALAAKAFFECPKCDRMYLRKVVQSFGMERDQRKRVPLLCHFLDNLPK